MECHSLTRVLTSDFSIDSRWNSHAIQERSLSVKHPDDPTWPTRVIVDPADVGAMRLNLCVQETKPTKVDFRFHQPEALADFCASKELG